MNENSNSVNISSKQRPYHHGNLRKVLVIEGLKLLNKGDASNFSLREVARNSNVSVTSVYRHFSSKDAFINALCTEGSKMLAAAQHEAMLATGGGQEGFDATGLAYVHFALANPSLFRLMRKASSGYSDPPNPSMQELLSNVATLMPKNSTAQQRQIRAFQAISVVHGITMLILDGRIPADDEIIMAVIRTPGT